MEHVGVALRWLGFSAFFSILPLLMAYGLIWHAQQHHAPPMNELMGSGQGMLVSIGMFASVVRESGGPKLRRAGSTDFLTWTALASMFIIASVYGFTVNERLHPDPSSTTAAARARLIQSQHDVVVFSCVLIALGVVSGASAAASASRHAARVRK